MEIGHRLIGMAMKMQQEIDHKESPLTQNWTDRRQRIKDGQLQDAKVLRKIQFVLDWLGNMHCNGEALQGKTLLSKVKTKAVILTLLSLNAFPTDSKAMTQLKRSGLYPLNFETALGELNTILDKMPSTEDIEMAREIEAQSKRLIKLVPGYFPTPKPVIDLMLAEIDWNSTYFILEPSAGTGHIADEIMRSSSNAGRIINLFLVERSLDLCEVLLRKGYQSIYNKDFLEFKEHKYDVIVMNPPFEKGQDMDHIRHAYKLLIPGGRLVSVLSGGYTFRNDKKTTMFRDWLEQETDFSYQDLPDGSFKESLTGVRAGLLFITKPPREWAKKKWAWGK